ncbi:putative lipoprotein YbbD precursor [Paenibacillus konkukensis]|uniref:beta-N-acetylhexosaminidase n=1 Tax=Paenibacillus konkukensis TaxID=2020716 RepID=A0ABY4RND3_9BACL|nr:beta-N-acetylhexosaminidase [Paenibacillus konkukensis]UQZ83470.1 putative lipoprotein YbbD precursor [Paenibacillus konkukensis]
MTSKWMRAALGSVIVCAVIAAGGCSAPSRQEAAPTPEAVTTPSPSPAPTPTPDPVHAVTDRMTTEEKLGQMMLFGVQGTALDAQTRKHITDDHVGGFIFYSDNIKDTHQAWSLISDMRQANAGGKLPLLLSADQEGGRVARLPKELPAFPTSLAVGKTEDPDYALRIGGMLGKALNAYGLNVDFAPVLDVNSNPNNPVIGDRSFGNSADTVSTMGIQEMKGLQGQGVISVVKHFPGHGDTSVDSHKDLPVVNHDINRLRSLEFVPFAEAIRQGADAVMVAHLLVTKLDPDVPSSLSRVIIQDYLRGELGFQGVVITDDLTMEAITKTMPIGTAAVKAVQAGADIVLVGHDPAQQQAVLDALKKAAEDGTLSKEAIDASAARIVKLKQKAKLPADSDSLPEPDTGKLAADIRSVVNSASTRTGNSGSAK